MEVKHKLLNFDNRIIYQNDEWFLFSLDSVLLANFVTLRLSDKNIIDLGTGNAPIPMLIEKRTKAKIYGVEIQKEIYDLAVKSVKENKLEEKIEIFNEDIKNIPNIYESDYFDVVTVNPPYFKTESKDLHNDNNIKTIARHEITITLDDILNVTKKILKTGGIFAMVHRPDRLLEIIDKMRKYGIQPKRLQFIYPKENKESNTILIEGIKNGKDGLKVLPPLIIHNNDNTYSEIITKMFQ